jgi:SAM-dependent methyltransferase
MNMVSKIKMEIKKIKVARDLYSRWYRFKKRLLSYNTQKVFVNKYQYNQWGSAESVSGLGSELNQTTEIVAALPALCAQYNIQSFLDLPCGDFNWIRHVSPFLSHYIGGDIVPQLIEANRTKYSGYGQFMVLNLLKDKLPTVDVIFSRDCLVHFSYSDIKKALANIKRANIKYLLTTSYLNREINNDIITGEWRPINLEKAPFYFPRPLNILIENSTEQAGTVKDKCLALWLVKDIPDF